MSGSPTHIFASHRARAGPAIVIDVPKKGSRGPRVTCTGSSRSLSPRVQYGAPAMYGRVGARSTAGVSTTERLVLPRAAIRPIAAVFSAQYDGHGKTEES